MEDRRFFYMDSMRSILMMLGITLHTASIYAVGANWALTDTHTCPSFDALIYFIHGFRLSSFFIISGFFALFILIKTGPMNFIKGKIKRILLPLLTTALTLNVIETYFRNYVKTGNTDISWFLNNILFKSFYNGEWDHHLWFLIYVFIFFVGSIFIYNVLNEATSLRYIKTKIFLERIRNKGLFLFIFPAVTILILGLAKLLPFTYINILAVFSIVDLFYWFPFFLFGMWLFLDKKLQKEFMQYQEWHRTLFFVFIFFMFARIGLYFHDIVPRQIIMALDIFISWFMCLGSFLIGFKYFNKPSKIWLYLSDASYSIYLLHHLLVILFGYLLLDFDILIYFKFIIINILVLVIALLIHHFIILKIGIFRLLFNGKRL